MTRFGKKDIFLAYVTASINSENRESLQTGDAILRIILAFIDAEVAIVHIYGLCVLMQVYSTSSG